MTANPYSIVTNSKGRKILVLHRLVNIEKADGIQFEDFEAIFIDMKYFSRHEVAVLLQRISPFYSDKCWIKPRFYTSRYGAKLSHMDYLVDGYAQSPTDDAMTKRIEEIYDNIRRLSVTHSDEYLHSHLMLCLRLCKYVIVRDMLTFTATTIPGYTNGYTALFMELFDRMEIDRREDMLTFLHQLINIDYVHEKRFIERAHICPECHNSHLLFIESCSKCGSSNMHQESVLHHFRCANVSPESTYEYDGQLRCPKCRHFLRHIGVDYDRPSEIYTCQDCGNTSLHSDMRVFCTQCHSTLKTSELHPFEIYEYEFTPKGQIAITSGQALLALAPDIWNGYTSFNQFRQLLHGFSNNSSSKDAVVTIRFKVAGNLMDEAKNMSLMQDIYIRFYYYNFTINPIRHCFYVSHRCMCDEIDAVKTRLETEIYGTIPEFLKRYDSNMHCTDRQVFIYRKGENIDMFLKQLNAITDY